MASAKSVGPMRTVLVAGASGLVGRELLRLCLVDPEVQTVKALLRRDVTLDALLGAARPDEAQLTDAQRRKFQPCIVEFDRLERHTEHFAVDAVFCALGTTMRQAGSQAAFRKVDFDAPLQIAQLARSQGASRFLLVSALGASARSRVFYSRVKGELEDALQAIGFAQFVVAQPSLLQGDRPEFRLGEYLGLWLSGLFSWLIPESHRPVHVRQVAQGLRQAACDVVHAVDPGETPPRRVLLNAWLRRMR
jgi:uncharacterized protein YbjT (DUF2867 family)